MNEEEKEAIKDIEEMIELFEDDCLLTTEDDIKYLKVILNLIEKQQKEIENLKSKKYILNAETNEVKEIPISDDYISKDKIRHIRDKAECMDYYSLNDDLSKLLGE